MSLQTWPKLCLFLKEMVAQRKLIRNTNRKVHHFPMMPVNTFWKSNQPPLKHLPCVVLSKPSVAKTCFIESGSTLKAPNLSCLAASDRKVKTLLTITLWLNLIMKSRTTLPHLDKGGGRKSTFTHLIYIYLSDCLFLKKLKWKKIHYDSTKELFLM